MCGLAVIIALMEIGAVRSVARQTAPDSPTTVPATSPATVPSTAPESRAEVAPVPATQPAAAPATSTTRPELENPPANESDAGAPTVRRETPPETAPAIVEPPVPAEDAPDASGAPIAEGAATTNPVEIPDAPYTRIKDVKGKSISLEIASRDFVRADGRGPKVCLVAVAHIADGSFYQAVQRLLDQQEVVLYESVRPAGTGGAHGDTDEERIASTRAAMRYVGGMIEAYHQDRQEYPADLDAVKQFAGDQDQRFSAWFDTAKTDAWHHPLVYQLKSDRASYELTSLGADGAPGGEGANADITLVDHPPSPLQLSKDDNLQVQLANALGLRFQLDSLTYSKPNWRCADMAFDEVNRALQAKGGDFSVIGGTLAGTSLPAKIIKFLLNLMKVIDVEGQIADTFKVIMIQMLGDPALLDRGMADQLGNGFMEVIVEQRNQRALDDLSTLIKNEPDVKSVAILYGAAHMPDMVERLITQFGYQPEQGPDGEHWLSAIKVDFTKSAVSAEELSRIRLMLRQMMRR